MEKIKTDCERRTLKKLANFFKMRHPRRSSLKRIWQVCNHQWSPMAFLLIVFATCFSQSSDNTIYTQLTIFASEGNFVMDMSGGSSHSSLIQSKLKFWIELVWILFKLFIWRAEEVWNKEWIQTLIMNLRGTQIILSKSRITRFLTVNLLIEQDFCNTLPIHCTCKPNQVHITNGMICDYMVQAYRNNRQYAKQNLRASHY